MSFWKNFKYLKKWKCHLTLVPFVVVRINMITPLRQNNNNKMKILWNLKFYLFINNSCIFFSSLTNFWISIGDGDIKGDLIAIISMWLCIEIAYLTCSPQQGCHTKKLPIAKKIIFPYWSMDCSWHNSNNVGIGYSKHSKTNVHYEIEKITIGVSSKTSKVLKSFCA
jgi:hypothetical protein